MRKGKDNILITLFKNPIQNIKRINLGEIPKAILDTMDILYEGKVNRPLLVKSKDKNKPNPSQYENGWHFVFTLNPGCSYEEVLSNKDYFNSVVEGNVEFKKVDKFLHIDVNTFEFKDMYKFDADKIKRIILTNPNYQKMYVPIVIGVKRGGKLLIVDIAKIPHILFAGLNNSGKSSWVIQLLHGIKLVRPEAFIIYLDLKGTDAPFIEPIGLAVARDHEMNKQVLRACIKEVDRRLRILIKIKSRKVHNLTSYNLPPIILAIDELTELKDKESQDMVNELARLSRATGFSLIIGTQYPSSKTYKDFCESRTQFQGRFCCRLAEAKDSRVVLDNHKAYELIPANKPGRAIWSFGENEIIQSLYIDDDYLDKLENNSNVKKEVIPFVEQIKEQKFWYLPR